VRDAARNEIFLPGLHWNALAANDQGVAALRHGYVFLVVVRVDGRSRGFMAGFHDSVGRVSHELGEVIHRDEIV
jgi:hypothetical protein